MNATTRPLTLREANRLAKQLTRGKYRVTRCDVDPQLWTIDGERWCEHHEPMTRERLTQFLREWCMK